MQSKEKAPSDFHPFGWTLFESGRQNKKLLVIDDRVFVNHELVNTPGESNALRPLFTTFLHVAYRYYDIILWSSIDGRLFNKRMQRLGILNNMLFSITLTIDVHSTFVAKLPDGGIQQIKSLKELWEGLSVYRTSDTIMIACDYANYICNEKNCIYIVPFETDNANDQQLRLLSDYLEMLAICVYDFRQIDHTFWLDNSALHTLNVKIPKRIKNHEKILALWQESQPEGSRLKPAEKLLLSRMEEKAKARKNCNLVKNLSTNKDNITGKRPKKVIKINNQVTKNI